MKNKFLMGKIQNYEIRFHTFGFVAQAYSFCAQFVVVAMLFVYYLCLELSWKFLVSAFLLTIEGLDELIRQK